MPPKVSTPAKPPPDWRSNPNRSSRQPNQSQRGTASNSTYFQCSDCPRITTELVMVGWFTEKAHMFKRELEVDSHIGYYCVGKYGNTLVWKRCEGQPLDEGEDPSLIDKAGNKYIEQNGTYVKVQAASHRDRPTSGDEDDEGYEEGDMEESVRDRRSTRQQQSTHQTSTGGGLKDEPLSEYDEDGATMTQNMSADNFEPHEHMDQFDGEDESLSQAVDKKPLKSLNPLNSAPTHASILDDVIAAGELQRELDDHEHPDSINDKKQALEESRKTAAAEKIKQQQQIKRLASAKAYGFDQLPASPALDYGEPMPHHSSSTMNFNRYSASEGSFSTSQGLPSNRRRSGANRDTLGSTAFNTPGYRAPGQPSTRWPRDERSLSPKESQTRRDESLLHVITRDA